LQSERADAEPLVITEELVDRMVDIENANLESRLRSYPNVTIERFGRATAFVTPDIPQRFFNSVLGTDDDTRAHLDDIEALYAARDVTPSFELVPARFSAALAADFHARGYTVVEQHVGLANTRLSSRPAAPDVEVAEVDTATEAWLDTYLGGWGAREPEAAKVNMRGWRANDSWRFYLASVDGEPAGAAALDVRAPTALLGSASTIERFRGRGVQAALLARRIEDASAAGCDLVVGGAYEGTTSVRNQQRAGFQIAFTRTVWSRG
jgi:GNAT superfamily N-acetyltransferase